MSFTGICTLEFFFSSLSRLQPGHIHLHAVIEGEDGGRAGTVGPCFHVTDALVEVFPAGQPSDGERGRARALGWSALLLLLLLPLQSGTASSRAVVVGRRLSFPVAVDGGVRGLGFGHGTCGPGAHRFIAGLLLGPSLHLHPSASPSAPPKRAREGFSTIVFHRRLLSLVLTHNGVGFCNLLCGGG